MDFLELFKNLAEATEKLDLSLTIELKAGGPNIWVYSFKYRSGKHIRIEDLVDIETIDFLEIATKNNVRRSIDDLLALGYSQEEIEERFVSEIHKKTKEVLVS